MCSADREDTLWRYAVPIGYDSLRGVAALDFASTSPPDSGALNDIVAGFRPTLSGAIALYVADIRGHAARALLDAARALSRNLDPDQVIETALDTAMSSTRAATGSVMLLDAATGRLRIVAARGLPEEVVASTEVAMGEGIAGWVAASNQPLLVEDLPGKTGRTDRHGVRSAVSVPIADEDGLLGVLNIGSRDFPARFTRAHLDILETLGRLAAVALRNARAMSSAGDLYFDTLKALVLALETKDPYAQGGTERVLHYSLLIGQAMGLSIEESHALEIAAMLHDIGMTGLDGSASTRPLSTVERGMLTMHPVIAADILEQAPALAAVVPIVYHHHEHFDGRGYVTGSSGDQIPLASRILAVADAYVAMTSDRPYRAAKTSDRAMRELSDKAGTQFDPDVVQTFLHLLGSDSNRVPDRRL
ncbi:MAG: GAF domain-containing protein [Actinomycetota bacterium]|nr:GAF domain-containing protein [Actinomycetota bacterium]